MGDLAKSLRETIGTCDCQCQDELISSAANEIERLTAEGSRLREAIKDIEDHCDGPESGPYSTWASDVARLALTPAPGGGAHGGLVFHADGTVSRGELPMPESDWIVPPADSGRVSGLGDELEKNGGGMNWQEKAHALNNLSDINLKIREAGNWYVGQSVEIGGDGMLLGSYGNGETPQEAIDDHWRQLVDDIPAGKYIVVNAIDDEKRKHILWNGFMWRELPK